MAKPESITQQTPSQREHFQPRRGIRETVATIYKPAPSRSLRLFDGKNQRKIHVEYLRCIYLCSTSVVTHTWSKGMSTTYHLYLYSYTHSRVECPENADFKERLYAESTVIRDPRARAKLWRRPSCYTVPFIGTLLSWRTAGDKIHNYTRAHVHQTAYRIYIVSQARYVYPWERNFSLVSASSFFKHVNFRWCFFFLYSWPQVESTRFSTGGCEEDDWRFWENMVRMFYNI